MIQLHMNGIKMNINRKFYKRIDFILIALVLLIGFIIGFMQNNADPLDTSRYAYIYYENTLVMQIDLNTAENTTFALQENPEIIFEIREGAIGFISSPCHDKICIKAGYISHDGETAVCLPQKCVLTIKSSVPTDVPDIIVR